MPSTLHHFRELTPELAEIQVETEELARSYGLDMFETIYEIVDIEQLNAVAAYGGFPVRYPHWRFGMEYEQLAKGYSYGLQKIYELVINNNPCYAYLLASNSLTDHQLVMAHVCGHCDFFKANAWFSQTNRKMVDEMANHGARIRRHMDKYGVEEVEEFIDACLSVEDLIDIHSPFIRRREVKRKKIADAHEEEAPRKPGRFQAKYYMDQFVNPKAALKREQERLTREAEAEEHLPPRPERDVCWFILEHAPLKPWQLDVLSIIRDEAYYFAPQGQTKIMNEGWASFWHSTLMTRHGLHKRGDVIDYADHCSGTLATSTTRLNPYKLGLELFRDIEDRWNRGMFGEEYEQCDDFETKRNWNTEAGLGREKMFEVRRIHNDLTFIDEFLTLDFCRRAKMFQFGYNEDTEYYEIESREFPKIKQQLLSSLTNMGRPIIAVEDGNYKNRGELYLKHTFGGPELKLSHAQDALVNLEKLWSRPVHIETMIGRQVVRLSYDGHEHTARVSDDPRATKKEEVVAF